MKPQAANEIIECLPKGKTPFHYFSSRYALLLLSYFVGEGTPVRLVKRSVFANLLKKAPVRDAIAAVGDGVLTKDLLQSVWPKLPECYLLTLGTWGTMDWCCQTSRKGVNLVLQLNFSSKENRPYYKIIRPREEEHPFEYRGHPIAQEGLHTLAWARLDIELDTGEALIEEIQSDWIKFALYRKATVEHMQQDERGQLEVVQEEFWGAECDPRSVLKYVDRVLKPHVRLWKEAMLCAAIWFLRDELGIHRIYYHTFDTGNLLKGLYHYVGGRLPPRSLYSSLPKRFCFQETDVVPVFLEEVVDWKRNSLRKTCGTPRFFLLEV